MKLQFAGLTKFIFDPLQSTNKTRVLIIATSYSCETLARKTKLQSSECVYITEECELQDTLYVHDMSNQ